MMLFEQWGGGEVPALPSFECRLARHDSDCVEKRRNSHGSFARRRRSRTMGCGELMKGL